MADPLPLSAPTRNHARPKVDGALPGIPYAAGLLGDGSEVLGFDTQRSTDHDWGPRVQLFFGPRDIDRAQEMLPPKLAGELPREFGGYSTQYHRGDTSQASDPWRMGDIVSGVEIHELGEWVTTYLGVDPRSEMTVGDWLAIPWSLLRGVTAGEVWRDDHGTLAFVRERVAWYPPDIWRYVVACQWQRINQEEPFVGRSAEMGDEVGSAVITARQLREVMHVCFLLQRQYPPYTKWLGTGFAQLDGSADLLTLMRDAIVAASVNGHLKVSGFGQLKVRTLWGSSALLPR